MMFKKVLIAAAFSVFVLTLIGCSGVSSVDGGLEPVETIVLDDEFSASVSVDKGDVFALDMVDPFAKGYTVTGAFFDPAILVMERFITYEDDGRTRVRYLFTVIGEGVTDVLVKMQRTSGGEEMVYKEVSVRIGSDKGWFD